MKNITIFIMMLFVLSCMLKAFSVSHLAVFPQTLPYISSIDTDYRNQYTGFYHTIIYYTSYQPEPIYDTIDTTMIVRKFQGYAYPTCSNFTDTSRKLALTWGDYSNPRKCNNVCYFDHNFIHPTINTNGSLEYPEFMTCGDGFTGNFYGDSVFIEYWEFNIMNGFEYLIKGKKDSVLTSLETYNKNSERHVSFYPNPASARITFINLSSTRTIVSILNLAGKQVIADAFLSQNQSQIDINSLTAGVYFVKMKTDYRNEYKMLIKQ